MMVVKCFQMRGLFNTDPMGGGLYPITMMVWFIFGINVLGPQKSQTTLIFLHQRLNTSLVYRTLYLRTKETLQKKVSIFLTALLTELAISRPATVMYFTNFTCQFVYNVTKTSQIAVVYPYISLHHH